MRLTIDWQREGLAALVSRQLAYVGAARGARRAWRSIRAAWRCARYAGGDDTVLVLLVPAEGFAYAAWAGDEYDHDDTLDATTADELEVAEDWISLDEASVRADMQPCRA